MIKKESTSIKGFLETSFLDWPGQLASVLFLSGCNFRCPFCHNYGLVLHPGEFPGLSWPDIKARLGRFTGWIDGVVISGGEPTLSLDLFDLAREIKELGMGVKLDTNGSRPEVLAALLAEGLLDHVAMDVKGPLDEFSYTRATGRPGFLGQVRTSLRILSASTVPYTLRTTIVPRLHSEKDIFLMAEQLRGYSEWRLQNFNPENALSSSYRCFEPFDPSYFEDLTGRALKVHAGAA